MKGSMGIEASAVMVTTGFGRRMRSSLIFGASVAPRDGRFWRMRPWSMALSSMVLRPMVCCDLIVCKSVSVGDRGE